jgi:murein DD-endopeptidase MepM/ murein hydrolase activator NlpD
VWWPTCEGAARQLAPARRAIRFERVSRRATTFGRARSALAAVILGSLLATAAVTPAHADTYPTWSEVKAAQKSESKAKAAIKRINALLASQKEELDAAKLATEKAGTAAEAAQNKADEQALIYANLKDQSDAAAVEAETSRVQAGAVISELYRSGGSDVSMSLMFSGDKADDLLYQLGAMSTIAQESQVIYERAQHDSNAEKALAGQAKAAKKIFDTLNDEAQAKLATAQAAQADYQAKQDAAIATHATLEAQLLVLTKKRKATQADYNAGVEARRKAALANGGHGYSKPKSSGWANPLITSGQWISSPYGYRVDPFNPRRVTFHNGTDIAVGCGTAVYAGNSGTVIYAGWYGSLGNVVQIRHGNGSVTLYGHLQSVAVHGGHVNSGQYIAKSGTTGASTGCHLYVRVTAGGGITNPQSYFSARGVTLGRP